ncbi:MAG: diaminopimelate epimerase, partial [bacterium]|nr:diaminopimelate epimerase [bacterium]
FTKMQGLGNDFVFLNGFHYKTLPLKKIVTKLCDRRFGIGADQLLLVSRSRQADFRMQIFNADGSEVEMCGNGLRCLARFVHDEKLSAKKEMTVETAKGIQTVRILGEDRIRVNMGEPVLRGREIPVKLSGRVINRPVRVEGKEFRMTCVSMGNPHAVIFVEKLKNIEIEKYGPPLENHSLFPRRANIEFVKVISRKKIEIRVWERGAGETLACGSGACAAVVASVLNGLTDRKVQVQLRGGVLQIDWNRTTGHLLMTGPAETVFKGEIYV